MKRNTHLVITLIFLLCSARGFAQLPYLIPYVDGNKWGYADSNGQVVIKPRWDKADFFSNGRAKVYILSGDWFEPSVIDTAGKYIIPPWRHWDDKRYNSFMGMRFNARGKKGKCGIIDSNNMEVIPCLYEKIPDGVNAYGSGIFINDVPRHRCVMVAKKNGKYGIIDTTNKTILPFKYDDIDQPFSQWHGSPGFYDVVVEGGHGLIDTKGKFVIPAHYEHISFLPQNQEDDKPGKWLLLTENKRNILADTTGKIIIDAPGYSVHTATDNGLILVEDLSGKYGLMNINMKIIIPCIYKNIRLFHDTIDVMIDSLELLGKTHLTYHEFYDIHTLKPLTEWLTNEQAFSAYYKANEAKTSTAKPSYEPRMKLHGGEVTSFIKNGITWKPTGYVHWPSIFSAVKGIAELQSTPYVGMVDTGGNFLFPPVQSNARIVWLNTRDSLLILEQNNKDSFQCVTDYKLQPLLHYQRYHIESAFFYNGVFYAVKNTDEGYMQTHPEEELLPYEYYHKHPGSRLITTNGSFVKGFEKIAVLNAVDKYGDSDPAGSSGTRPWQLVEEEVFAGCLLVEDENGKTGIVDLTGKIEFPAISFKYDEFNACGFGIFRVRANRHQFMGSTEDLLSASKEKQYDIGYHGQPYLVDSSNNILLDGLTVEAAYKVVTGNTFYYEKGEALPLISVYLKNMYKQKMLYMDYKGHGYYGKLPVGILSY